MLDEEQFSTFGMSSLNKWPFFLSFIGFVIGFVLAGYDPEPYVNKCGNVVDNSISIGWSLFLLLISFYQFWLAISHRVAWSETELFVRDRLFRVRKYAVSELSDFHDGSTYTQYKFGNDETRVFDWVGNISEFNEFMLDVMRQYASHFCYAPALKDLQNEAESAGCLRCYQLFDPADVMIWDRKAKKQDFELASCPVCNTTEGVVWGMEGVSVDINGLNALNEISMSELGEEERLERQREIDLGRSIALQKDSLST
jgi:hypothetical protein